MELTGSLLTPAPPVVVLARCLPLMLLLFQVVGVLFGAGRNDIMFDVAGLEAATTVEPESIRLLVITLLVIDGVVAGIDAMVVCLLVVPASLEVDNWANKASICCDTALEELLVPEELAAPLPLAVEFFDSPSDKFPRAERCSSCKAATLSNFVFCSSSTLANISLTIETSARN